MLIVGCGYTGRRLARRLLGRGERVSGLVRSSDSAAELPPLGIEPVQLDLDHPGVERSLAAERIYYLAPPPSEGREDTRLANFLARLVGQTGNRLVYLGTTGVYGNCGGEWVDEERPVAPTADRAHRRWHAEQQLLAWREQTGAELIRLRVAGIYGPGRLPLARLRAATPMVAPEAAPWTNRIHVDDLVSTLVAAMDHGIDGRVYNVSDGQPGNMADYFNQVADATGLPRPPVISADEAEGQLSAGLLSYLAESRRLSNRRMLDELGVELRYPDLRTGIRQCLGMDE